MREDNPTALKQGIGNRVRALRKDKRLKQQALTEMIGAKSHSTISALELGRRMPSPATLHALAAVLQVPVWYLLGDMPPEPSADPEAPALKASLRSELAEMRSCLERATTLLDRCS